MIDLKSLREKEEKELRKDLTEARMEILQLRGKRTIGSLANTAEIRAKRREVARILTVLGEKEVLKKLAPVEEKEPSIVKNNGKKEA
ncbi:MAG: 50S ribosomal protein L29 [Patescibacteria group bacterium]